MPEFIVRFPCLVRYLPDHYNGKDVSELVVSAPTSFAALVHALRVTRGDAGSSQSVEDLVVEAYVPPVEIIEDKPYTFPEVKIEQN